jgi:hypothetical protein
MNTPVLVIVFKVLFGLEIKLIVLRDYQRMCLRTGCRAEHLGSSIGLKAEEIYINMSFILSTARQIILW